MKAVVLVPWRSGDFTRELSWRFVRSHLETYGWGIFTGDAPGVWARAQAVNAAAASAGEWDVALISDADTVGDKETIDKAVTMALETGGAIRPHNRLWMLRPDQTADFLRFGREGTIINFKTKLNPGGGLMVVSRTAWDKVGGYDEDFTEWGHEDSDFNTRLLVHAYWDIIEGDAFHLYHERDTTKTPGVMANRQRMRRTQAEHALFIEEESQRRGWNLAAYL